MSRAVAIKTSSIDERGNSDCQKNCSLICEFTSMSPGLPIYAFLLISREPVLRRERNNQTHVDELNLPDLFDQLHGGVTIDEKRLCVVAELQ